ncbi:unnamed protein product [Sphagnum compactum]
MSRPRRLSSSSSLTRTLSRLSSSSPSTSSTIAVRNEHTRIYTCLIAGALLLLASVTFLQVHLASAPQGSNILASPDNNDNSESRKDEIKLDSAMSEGVIEMVERQQEQRFETGGNQEESDEDGGRKAGQGTLDPEKEKKKMKKKKGLFFWDRAFGIRKKSLKIMELLDPPQQTPGGTTNSGTVRKGLDFDKNEASNAAPEVSSQQLRGFKEFVENWKERFNSDDEMLDEKVQQQLEDVVEIEDALLLDEDGPASKPLPRLPIKKAGRHGKKGGGSSYDPINPVNFPMLQDPDTTPDTWMTNSDKAMLKAFQVDRYVQSAPLPPKLLLRGMNVDSVIHEQKEQETHRMLDKDAGTTTGNVGGAMGMGTELSSSELSGNREEHERLELHQQENQPIHDTTTISNGLQSGAQNQDFVQQANLTGSHPSLPFSVFMDKFLHEDSCSIRVFMAWTTPPWSFTVRHQRTLESLLHFHPNACVVVFSETIKSDFFNTFVQEGFKVAVVQPNLQELLANTPTDVFTTILVRWRQIPLFHQHYTELLRLVALYKYGGVYMDMDVIVLKPLDSLSNTVGSEILANGEIRLNGAIMAFNKSSPFLRQCLEEFTATYDDTLLEWNGAELVTRVANSSIGKGGKRWIEDADVLQIQEPFAFFPIPSSKISRYLVAPTDKQQDEEKELLGRIIDEAYTTHLWNRLTASMVPENGSVIETILNRHCLHCTDIL